MNPKFNLNVAKPCSETFDSFTPTKQGGFCSACQKEVIDFTQMNEREILEFFKNKQGNTCGRFLEPQLKIYEEFIPKKRIWNLNMFGVGLISFSLISLLSNQSSYAQFPKTSATFQEVKEQSTLKNTSGNNLEITISGTVVDEDNYPIPGVSVVLKNTTFGNITDANGKFTFQKPLKEGDILVFTFIGYKTIEYSVSKNTPTNQHIEIILKEDLCELMGEVSVEQIYESKPSFWQKVKRLFK